MNTLRKCSVARLTCAGFSLIEVLVTLLLIGIGVLGMAALQGRAIAYSNDTLQRTTAAMLANDLLELVRATPGEWSRYLQTPVPQAAVTRVCPATPSQPPAQFACWRGEVAALLPGAVGSLASDGSAIDVQVNWGNCSPTGAACHYRLRSEL